MTTTTMTTSMAPSHPKENPPGFDKTTRPHASRIPVRAAPASTRRRVVKLKWHDETGPHEVQVERSVIIGSSPSVSLRLGGDPLVSRLHAEVTVHHGAVWVRDLASKNGTFIDSIRIVEASIPSGAKLRVGSTIVCVTETLGGAPPELWPHDRFGVLTGKSEAMRELFARLARVAACSMPVLVCGETGTGKELVARTIHGQSARAAHPFVVMDCASLSGNEGEMAELFASAIESARGGTMFLDEIADLPMAMQSKLVRALSPEVFILAPLDSHSATISTSSSGNAESAVRFIAGTQRDLPKLVSEGNFREDLYFRLAVLPVTVPPLRERLDDLMLLVGCFLPTEEHQAITPKLLDELAERSWAGNVRELRNFVERLLTFGAAEALDLLPTTKGSASGAFPRVDLTQPFKEVRDRWVSHLEREYLRGVLARTGGNVAAAAQEAGLDRAYVYRLIRKHTL